jgi:hypothetical protein
MWQALFLGREVTDAKGSTREGDQPACRIVSRVLCMGHDHTMAAARYPFRTTRNVFRSGSEESGIVMPAALPVRR